MASKINADEFVDREGEGKPTLPKGVVLSGVTTITTAVVAENEVANSTGINAGIITSTHFAGNLTGDVNAGIVTVTSQTVIGSAVTISASGIDIGAGVITATSYAGGGGNLTGIGATIMVWEYNPDPSDMSVPLATGIGITFNQKIKAGSGNITLREDSSSGTVVENFGIGSSVTIVGNSLSMTPTSNLSELQNYHLSYPSGVITNMAGESYVGTAYTFKAFGYQRQLWVWGDNREGGLGQNNEQNYSSPVQVPGTTWRTFSATYEYTSFATKTDGTLWAWGYNQYGSLAQNTNHDEGYNSYSSPIQIPGTWDTIITRTHSAGGAIKTDGTLWTWGRNQYGNLGLNNRTEYSSPVQIPGTTWSTGQMTSDIGAAIKTDGTMWSWGQNAQGCLGLNQAPAQLAYASSPVQIPGTSWSKAYMGPYRNGAAIRTDGTLWVWGYQNYGQLGLNNNTVYSSPVQIPGTWSSFTTFNQGALGTKTDGTLWGWGRNYHGSVAQNNRTEYSSPVQIGSGTDWSFVRAMGRGGYALKTDGTLWCWGKAGQGGHDRNEGDIEYSSPVQIPGTDWGTAIDQFGNNHASSGGVMGAIKLI